LRALLLILTIFIIFSGCVEEKNVSQSYESAYRGSVNTTPENLPSTALSSEAENIPEIELTSLSSIYMHDNYEIAHEYLFSWDNVPGNESDKLSDYLRNDLGISHEGVAQFVKSDDNKTIRVHFTSGYSTELSLEGNNSYVLITPLRIELEVKEVNGKLYIYKVKGKSVINITEKRYLVYNLSITNNGSKNLDFRLNELNVRDGDNIHNAILKPTIEPGSPHSYIKEILSDLDKETKIKDTNLSPGQTISGSVIFPVTSSYDSSNSSNSSNSLHNESFLLLYKENPITSTSFEKCNEALSTAEQYNYSVIFGVPTYCYGGRDSFELDFEDYPSIWTNYVNRSLVEFFKKIDSDEKLKYSPDIPPVEIVYALKVIPERNITSTIESIISYPESYYPENHFIVVDDTGEELINASIIDKIAVLKNQTYELHSRENLDIPNMDFSNATIVKISYRNVYGWPMVDRASLIDQDFILDDKMNLVEARYHCGNFIG